MTETKWATINGNEERYFPNETQATTHAENEAKRGTPTYVAKLVKLVSPATRTQEIQ